MSEIKKDQFKKERRELWAGVAIAASGTGADAVTIKSIADDVVKSFDTMFKKDKTGEIETAEDIAEMETSEASVAEEETVAETPAEEVAVEAEVEVAPAIDEILG